MSLALSTLLFEWRRYMAAVMALALSGLMVLAMTGVFVGIGKGFTAQIERSRADIMVLAPRAKNIMSGPSGLPRRFLPVIYQHPEVVEVQPLDGAGGSFQTVRAPGDEGPPPKMSWVQTRIIDTTPDSVTIPIDYSDALVDALRQPLTVAVDETSLKTLGVKLGDKALYNGKTVTVVAVTRGYPNMMQATLVMSRDTLRMLGQADTGPRVGPLMVKLRDPARTDIVVAQLNATANGQYKAWSRADLAAANESAMFEEGILVIILGGITFLGIVIGVAITWQTLRGAIMANIKEFASLRALGVSMGSLRRIVVELSFWVGVTGVAASALLVWLVSLLAAANGVIMAFPPMVMLLVGGGLIIIAILSGLMSLGVLKKSQPADLLR